MPVLMRPKKFHKLVAFDFDNTITQDIIGPTNHHKSYLDVMGGQQRLNHLKKLFETLTKAGVQIIIVSFNVEGYVRHFLQHVGLFEYITYVFDRYSIYRNLKKIMPNQHALWKKYKKQYFMMVFVSKFFHIPGKSCLLVDDQQSNLDGLDDFCGTLKIYTRADNRGFGIRDSDILKIYLFFNIIT